MDGVTPDVGGFSYYLTVLCVVENQPISLDGSTSGKPVQAQWFNQWITTLAIAVGKW
jgi:hypothetical protein